MISHVIYLSLFLLGNITHLISKLPGVTLNGTDINTLLPSQETEKATLRLATPENFSHVVISIKDGAISFGVLNFASEVFTDLSERYNKLSSKIDTASLIPAKSLNVTSPSIIKQLEKISATENIVLGTTGVTIKLNDCFLSSPNLCLVGKSIHIENCFLQKPKLLKLNIRFPSACIEEITISFRPDFPHPYLISVSADTEADKTTGSAIMIFGASELQFGFDAGARK